MKLNMIVAYGKNRVIGNIIEGKGKMPGWRIPSDMDHFKDYTVPDPTIMGRMTWESFSDKFRPLPGRDNILITRDKLYVPKPMGNNVHICHSLAEAVEKAKSLGFARASIIGGGMIYSEALTGSYRIGEICATEIDGTFEGNVYFPRLDSAIWKSTLFKTKGRGPKDSHEYEIIKYSLY